MLRITLESQTSAEVVLKIEGWLSTENLSQLQEEGTHRLQESCRLVLEVSNMKAIDEAGVYLLRQWSKEGLILRSASSFVSAMLEAKGLRTISEHEP